MAIAAPTPAKAMITRRSCSSTARIQSRETASSPAGTWSPDGCCARTRADGWVIVLQLPHLDRGAQRRVHIELNLAGVAKRGHKDCVYFHTIDRAGWLHHQPDLAQPLLRGIIVDDSDHVQAHLAGDPVGRLHDFAGSVEDHALHSPTPQLTKRGSNPLLEPLQGAQNG